jgi:F-type H+-transporting ATPase subunit gamma
LISEIHVKNRQVHIICAGTKPYHAIEQKLLDGDVMESAEDFYKNEKLFHNSQKLAEKVTAAFLTNSVDKVSVVYTKSYSIMRCKVEIKSIIPLICEPNADKTETIFEPSVENVLKTVVPYNIAVQIYQSALESVASEQGSRMMAMDSATRNADELLSHLTTTYNRARQYNITQELVEVVSGASAVAKG